MFSSRSSGRRPSFSSTRRWSSAAAALLTFAIAFLVGRQQMPDGDQDDHPGRRAPCCLGPPLAYAGYSFLRDDEQGAFVGKDLLIRCLACGLVYALAWGVYWYVGYQVFDSDDYAAGKLELFQVGILVGDRHRHRHVHGVRGVRPRPDHGVLPLRAVFRRRRCCCARRWACTLLPGIGGA